MNLDPTQLKEPVTLEDALDLEEYIEIVVESQKALFDRVRFQYQGDTWISNALWDIHNLLEEAAKKMAALRATNCWPR